MKNCNNRQAAKISVLSSGKIDKYEYYRGEEILLGKNILWIL